MEKTVENTLIIVAAFNTIFQSIKDHVTTHLVQYHKDEILPIVQQNPTKKLIQKLPCDPKKVSTKFQHKKNSMTLNGIDEFVKLYVGNASLDKNFSVSASSDIRVFLTIWSRAGCFPEVQSDIALRLKESKNGLAHDQAFDQEKSKNIIKDMEKLLGFIQGSENCQRKLKQLMKHGMKYIQNMSGHQLSALQSSLEGKDIADSMKGPVKSFIASTINNTGNGFQDQEVQNKKPKSWTKMPVMNEELDVEWMECVTGNSGNTMNLQTIINRKIPKFSTSEGLGGIGFKMTKIPFAKGSSRLAYRGHFESVDDSEAHLQTEVVVKKSSIPAEELLKIQAVAEVFEDKWNDLHSDEEGQHEIEFLDLYMAKMNGTEYTIENYIDRTKYRKWSNNNGYVNTESYEPVLDAFSHWTHDVTRGQMMVVDLQGEKRSKTFLLTDPVIHSATGDYGSNNRRTTGMHKFFKTHICNHICTSMGLTVQIKSNIE